MKSLRRWRTWLVLLIAAGGLLWLWERLRTWREDSHDPVILAAAARHGVHPALIKAVVWRESKFNPNVRGSKGEIGLMQIMPATAKEWAQAEQLKLFVVTDLFRPAKNTQCGAWCLRKALLRYLNTDNPVPYALADYNAGRGNVLKWMHGAAVTNSAAFLAQIRFPGTKQYVVTTMERYERYRAVFPARAETKSP
jgi:soluble lytic murein transglycosylase